MDKLVLIDGNSIVNRAFYGVPDLTNREGLHTNAIYGFLNILLKILDEENPTHLLVAFDVKAPTFRHEMFDEYKGTRKPMPGELREQIPVLKEILSSMNIQMKEQAGIEADDILGTMAKTGEAQGLEVSVVSGDRDLLQLATDKIKVRIPKTKGGKTTVLDYNRPQVIEEYGVTPEQIIDLKGLMGDSSDNIPGVPGVGEKTAVKILTLFGTVENAIAHVEEITPNRAKEAVKNNTKLALLSKKLATIKTDCKLGVKLEECRVQEMFTPEAYEKISVLEFKSLMNRFEKDTKNNAAVEDKFETIQRAAQLHSCVDDCIAKGMLSFKLLCKEKADKDGQTNGQMTLFMEEEGSLFGGAITADGEKVSFFAIGGELSEQVVKDELERAKEAGVTFITNDLKKQLPELPELDEKKCFDTSVAAYLIYPVQKGFEEEDISTEYAEFVMPPYSQMFGKKTLYQMWQAQPEDVTNYACYCALVSFLSYKPLHRKLKTMKSYELFEEIEMPLVFTLYRMEQEGIYVKREALRQYSEKLGERIDVLEQEIYNLAGEEFNINSPKQLGVILFEKLRMPYGKKTKTGYSTAADVLEKLAPEAPIVSHILEYRQLTKLKSTYADGLFQVIAKDGRIHSTFNQTITTTGRISSTEPNLQNIPVKIELGRELRKVFIPQKDCVYVDADYSQIELRVMAAMSGDEVLINAFKENQDIHRLTASQVFGVPFDDVTPLQRSNAKAVNFGIIYGIGSYSLSQDIGITKKEADKYIAGYFAKYPKVKEFVDNCVETARETGYATTIFNRRRYIPEITANNFMQRSFGERVAMNMPVQGSAADIIKIAMVKVWERLKALGLKSRLVLQVHDELLIETYKDEQEQVERLLQEEMENAVKLSVPLIAEVHSGNNWYEVK